MNRTQKAHYMDYSGKLCYFQSVASRATAQYQELLAEDVGTETLMYSANSLLRRRFMSISRVGSYLCSSVTNSSLLIVCACVTMNSVSQCQSLKAQDVDEEGFTSLFNGRDLSGWIVPEGDNGHWQVVDRVIDYDAGSEAKGDKNLWTEKEFGNFVLHLDWRIKETSGLYNVPIVLQDGSYLKDAQGKKLTVKMPNADSGVYVRGTSKAQLNIWCWPIGSGEVYGYRNPDSTDPEIRRGVTPRVNADHPVGEWNHFMIIMIGDELTVIENNQMVLERAKLPGIPERGRIALQHHGGINADGSYKPASSLVQFRDIRILELN